MGKLVVIKIGDGKHEKLGFPVTLYIGEEGASFHTSLNGQLPPEFQLPLLYGEWRLEYEEFLNLKQVNLPSLKDRKEGKRQKTFRQDFVDGVNRAETKLITALNNWLNSETFRPIKDKFQQKLKTDETVRVIIQTEDPLLRRLPWYLWDLFGSYRLAEVALSSPEFERVDKSVQPRAKVRILAILGDRSHPQTGIPIDIEADRRVLESLPDAETVFLVEPNRQKFNEQLWDEGGWDVLFFAGHSSSQPDATTGKMYINPQESLMINELKYALQKAIERGLQVAIFNSCDGLGIARDLAELHIPQIIVMREPVPDLVAKDFLKYFLSSFSSGKSLYLAVREARERLHGLENYFPCASWLPVICQNPAIESTTWNQLKGISDLNPAVEFTTLNQLKEISALSTKKETGNLEKIANLQNPTSRREFQYRRALLSEVRAEVWGLLEQSLQNAILINLHKENEQNSVKQSWDVEVKVGNKKNRETVKSSIIEIFDRESIAGRLLILGAPGAGKTTTLLELAQELIKRAENDASEPIPVLFNLSSWKDDNQTISQLLIQELKIKYGVHQKVGKILLQEQQLSLLLDGLDELASERQKKCVQAINQFMESEERPLYIVVCSRSEEYKLWKTPLKLNGAFCLSSLTQAQIQQYLTRVKLSNLWEKINKFPVILELIETPLFLSMMTMAYKSLSIDEWGSYTTKETCREYLLKVYVERMLTREIKNLWYRESKEPKLAQVKYWLSWLANYLKFSSEFYIENLQPNCLENKTHKIIYLTLTNDSLWIKIYSLMVILLLSFVVGFLVLFNLNITAFTAFTGGIIFLCGLCVYFDWELWLIFPSLISLGMLFPNFLSFLLSNQASKVIFYFVLVLFPFIYSLAKVLLVLTLHFEYNNSHNWLKKCFGKNYVNDIGTIYILDSLKWSWHDAKKNLMGIFDMGISEFEKFAGVLTALIFSVVWQLPRFLKDIQLGWQGFSFIFFNFLIGVAMLLGFIATITGIFHGLRVREFGLEEKRFPNQGIYYSLTNTIRIIVFYTVPSSLFFSIFSLYFFILSSINNLEIYANKISNVFLDGCLGIIFGFILSMVIGINGNEKFPITPGRFHSQKNKGFVGVVPPCLPPHQPSNQHFRLLGGHWGTAPTENETALPITQGKGFQSAKVVIQHFILRLLLWFSGYIPWNYARFLNYATERMLLRRVGGRYQFIHRFLQEYFANIKLN